METKYHIKKIFKKLLIRVLFGHQKIIIASTGRSGSHVLFDAVADSLIRHKFHLDPEHIMAIKIKRLCTKYVSRIEKLPTEVGVVCKTHDVYEHLPKANYKFIFVYGDALDAALSVEQEVIRNGIKWFFLHQHHLKAIGDYSDLYKKDVLNYQVQLENWMNPSFSNIFCISYEEMWDKTDELSEFCGFNVYLPARRPRKEKQYSNSINKDLFEDLRILKNKLKIEYDRSIVDRFHIRHPAKYEDIHTS